MATTHNLLVLRYVLTGMIWLRFLKIIIIVLPPLSLGIIMPEMHLMIIMFLG